MTTPPTVWDFWAPRYEGLWAQRYSLGPTRRLIQAHITAAAAGATRFLDLGCGVGQLAAEIAHAHPGAEVLGCDPSAAMIARAVRDYAAPNLHYLHCDVTRVTRGTGFDVITCTHAFPYAPDKPATLRAMAALLRPGGRLLIAQANTENLYDWAWLLFVRLTTTPSHYHSATGLHALMREAGLRPGVVRSVEKPFWIPSIQMVEGIS
jgi:2-polyprenyl-3-methyl-5-hydroxy-6-metoxy-1,4-benzoquinol methylase